MSYCRLFVIAQFVNDLKASGSGQRVRHLTTFPMYEGKSRKISVGTDRQLTNHDLNYDVCRMRSSSVKTDRDIIKNMSLNYGEGNITRRTG